MPDRPTIAVSTGPLWRVDLDEAFALAKAAGAEGAEILVTQNESTQSPNDLERLASRHDLPIVAIHAPQLLLTRRVYGTNQMEKIRKTVELCRALDVQTVVLHPPYLWQVRYVLWSLNALNDAFADAGPVITMENMFPVHVGKRRLKFHSLRSVAGLKRFDNVTLDTSHLAVSEDDIVESYRALADRVVHIHLSDNRGKGRDSHAPLGEGILPIDDFIAALDGPALRTIALEINPGPGAEQPGKIEEILGASIDRVRRSLPSS